MGFGAIMPGISGGTLCVAFGVYKPLIEIMSNPVNGIKKHWKLVIPFLLGAVAGFVGLAGLAGCLLDKNSAVVTCVFVGFILGTFPELLNDAAKEGRRPSSYVSMVLGFIVMFIVLLLLRKEGFMSIEPGIWSYFLCGILWGLSFVVPGLSSSTLLMFFGLYQPMLKGISGFKLPVIIPLGIGALLCILLLSKLVNAAFKKFYNVFSHLIVGIVAATTVMIMPDWSKSSEGYWFMAMCIIVGAAISYALTKVCAGLKN